jgi:hypothetical protein
MGRLIFWLKELAMGGAPNRLRGDADPAGLAVADEDDPLAAGLANLAGVLIRYARVSTSGQNLDRQARALTRISTQDVRGNPASRSPGGQSGGWRVYLLERLWPPVAAGAWCCGVAARVEVSVICYACVMMPSAARFA